MSLLDELAARYGTDKGTWGYLPHYERVLGHRRQDVSRVLEIGISGERDIPNNVTGASLWMWRDYFPSAHIHGIDNDPRWMLQADRISSYLGDQRDPASLAAIAGHGAPFDLIVDDAIHDPDVQLGALVALLPFLRPGGVYAIEDVCPYKMPGGDVGWMTARVPPGYACEVVRTHAAEVLILVTADPASRSRAALDVVPGVSDVSDVLDVGDRPLLGLVMIVRDEAGRLPAVLRSLRPHIDRWTILDTGSTDGTQALIRRELAGLPGDLHEEPFVDFSTSRNRALALHGGQTVFTFMPNCDALSGGDALRGFLSARRGDAARSYSVRVTPGCYYHPLVLRAGGGWHYRGRTHECATGPLPGEAIPGVHVIRDRGDRTDAEWRRRWCRDLDLLNRDLADDPSDPRPHFYLGQTHEGLGQHEAALAHYRRRAELGGYFDEIYEAKFRVGRVLDLLGRPWSEVQQAYLEAYAFDPRRAEPLRALAGHWRKRGSPETAHVFDLAASGLPRPSTDLFLDEDAYDRPSDQAADSADRASVACYHAGRRDLGRCLARSAVARRPGDERLRANWGFYARPATELLGARLRSISLGSVPGLPAGWHPSTPSICRGMGRLRCVVRAVNYRIEGGAYVTPAGDGVIRTRNFLVDLGDDLEATRSVEMIDRTGNLYTDYPIHGFEDARLFAWRDRWWATATVCDLTQDGQREIALLGIDEDGAVRSADPLRGPWSGTTQKNWMPLVDGDACRLIYATHPTTVLELTSPSGPVGGWGAGAATGHGRLRGGSQAVRVPGGWLAVVHDVVFPGDGRMYLHRIARFDEQLRLAALTEPFYFEELGIEFCAGLAVAGVDLVASYSVRDGSARLAICPWERIRPLLAADFVV